MALKYNPKRIKGSFTGKVSDRNFAVKLSDGFMKGTFVEVDYDEKAVTVNVSSDGTVTLVLNANKVAKLKVTFVQGAAQNDDLSVLVPDGDNDFLPLGAILLEDLNGTTRVKAAEACIESVSPVKFGDDVQGREWTFILTKAEIFSGGNAA